MKFFLKVLSLPLIRWFSFLISFLSIFAVTPFEYRKSSFKFVLSLKASLVVLCACLLTSLFLTHVIKNNRLNKFSQNLAVLVYSLLLNFILLEGIFAFIPQSHRFSQSLAAKRWSDYYWTPLNQFGFRDREFSLEELKQKKRIFVLGDSFTAGYGIEDIKDRFSNILDKKLSPHNFCVMNLGVSGADTQTELALYYKFPVKPHLLIYQYYGNDIDTVAFEKGKSYSGNEPYLDLNPAVRPIVKNSHFLDFVYWQLPHENGDGFVKFLANAFETPEILSTHLSDIQKILFLSKERSIPVIVVLFPFLTSPEDSTYYTRLLKNFFQAQGAAVINVEDLISDIPVTKRVVNKLDLHPSTLVHRRVADALYNKLVEWGYVSNHP